MTKIPGIYVEIRGDYDRLKKDIAQARQNVTEQARGMSNALNNALSPQQIQGSVNRLVKSLNTLGRASQLTGKDFDNIGVDIGRLRNNLGMTEAQFLSLQRRMLNTSAERAQERALRSIARSAQLTKSEIRALGIQMNLSKAQIDNVVTSMNRAGRAGERAGNMIGGAFTRAATQLIVWQYTAEMVIRAVDRAVFDFNASMEVAQIGIASGFLTQGSYVDQLTGKVLEGQRAFNEAQRDALDTTEKLKAANLQTIATLQQVVKGYQVTMPVALAKGFDNDQIIQFTLAMVQAAGAIDDTGQLMNQLGEETRSLLTESINPRTSRIATALGIRNEDIRQYRDNADGLFSFLMERLSAYQAAGDRLQESWRGIWSNFVDIAQQQSGKAFEPLFEAVKYDLKAIIDDIMVLDKATQKMDWNPDFVDGIEKVQGAVRSIIAEFRRFSMLVDKVGGTMTTIGAMATFGSWDEKMRQWNEMFEARYKAQDKALQQMANIEAGLNPDGSSRDKGGGADYVPDPKKDTVDASAGKLINQAKQLELDAIQAFEDKKAEMIQAGASLEAEINQQQYEWGLKTLGEYLEKKHALRMEAIDAEIDAKKKEVAAAQLAMEGLAPVTDKQGQPSPERDRIAQARAERELYTAEQQLIQLEGKRAVLGAKNSEEIKQYLHDQERGYQQLSIEILNLTGQTVAAQQAQNDLALSSKEYLQLEREAAAGNLQAVQALADVKRRIALEEQKVALAYRERVLDDRAIAAELKGDWQEYYQLQVDILENLIAQAEATGRMTAALKAELAIAESLLDPLTAFEQGFKRIERLWGDTAGNMAILGEETARAMHSAFSEFFFDALEGELDSFSDYIQSFLTSINRALANAMASSFLASSGIGAIGSDMGAGLGGLFSALFHTGGVAGVEQTKIRPVPLDTFQNAPRYHTGLLPGEFPAILEEGEGVFTPGQMKALGGMIRGDGDGSKTASITNEIMVDGGSRRLSLTLKREIEQTCKEVIRREM